MPIVKSTLKIGWRTELLCNSFICELATSILAIRFSLFASRAFRKLTRFGVTIWGYNLDF
jgi:hypothetical protein